jgi:hypothetical protein
MIRWQYGAIDGSFSPWQWYRRLVVRWERLAACFTAFLAIATIHLWVQRLIVG